MKQGANKKRGTFATKIIAMVILAIVISNVICMVFILESSKKQITDSVKHTMVDVVSTTSKIMENEISNSDADDLDYDGYAKDLSGVKLEGMDSSYMYVVQNDGTMLYHPTKEKVGQPVENAVIKGVVNQLQDGKKPGTTVVEYDFNGTTKYSAYTILNNENILVLTADESEALSGSFLDCLWSKTNVAKFELCSWLYIQRVVTINVGNGAIACTFLHDANADERFAIGILHGAADLTLCKCERTHEQKGGREQDSSHATSNSLLYYLHNLLDFSYNYSCHHS